MKNIDRLSDEAVRRLESSFMFGFDAAAVALALAELDKRDVDPVIRERLARIRALEAQTLAILSARILSPGQPEGPRETRRP